MVFSHSSTRLCSLIGVPALAFLALVLTGTGPEGPVRGESPSPPSAEPVQALDDYALQFRGGDYVSMGSMDLSGFSITIQAWVKPRRFPNAIHTIAGMERSGEAAALLRVGDAGVSANKPQFVVQIGDGQAKLTAESGLATGRWQHVAATYDGSHLRLYINGELDAIRDQEGRASAEGVFRVARSFGGRPFFGTIDEVEVWRAALSAKRIREGMDERLSQRGGRVMGYWPFDEGRGRTAEDRSDNRRDGTINGASWVASDALHERGRRTTAPASTSDSNVKGFLLTFPEASLTYTSDGAGPQVALGRAVVDYGDDWEVARVRDYLYHLRKPHWEGSFWEVNTSRREVYHVERGTFGDIGGAEELLDITVVPTGDPEAPERFQLQFSEADLLHATDQRGPRLTVTGPGQYRTTLTYGGEWEVERMKGFLFHVRQQDWSDFFWKVNTSRRTAYRVDGGTFGAYGGAEEALDLSVQPIAR